MDIKNKLAWVFSLVLLVMVSASLSVMAAIQLGTETITFTQPIIVSAPTLSTHAATKQYVDSAVAGTTQGTVTSITAGSGLSGGTITTSGTIAVDSTVIRTTGNQTLGGTKTFSSAVVLSTAGTLTTHAVRADRSISTGSGLSGGGNLTANRTLTVDSTVIRTTGNQTLGGTKTFSSPVVVATPTGSTHATTKAYVDSAISNLSIGNYVLKAGDTMTGKLTLDSSNLTIAPLNIPRYGTTNPTTTESGDLWYRSNNLYYNDQGTVRTIAHTGSWSLISEAAILAGTETTSRFISAARLKYAFNNVATPTAASHATTKSYVDTAVSNAASKWTTSGSNTYLTTTINNVGIGTTSPSAKLHVLGADTDNADLVTILSNSAYRGTFAIRNGVSNNPSFLLGTTGPSEPLAIMTEGTEKMRINANGNVGINTTSPGYKLTVNGTIGTSDMNNPYLVLDSSSAGGNAAEQSAQISLGESGRGSASLHLAYTGDGYSYIGMGTLTNNVPQYYAMKMYYQNNNIYFPGSVGIGQTSPGYKLDVSGTGKFTGAVIVGTPTASNHATTKAYVDSMFSGSGPWTLSGSNVYVTGTSNNVGIGTTTPGARLQILDGTLDKAAYQFKASSTSAYTTSFNMDDVGLDIGHNSSSRAINFLTASLDRMTITGDGKVGIGTTSPTGMLHIYSAGGTIIRAAGATNIENAGGIDFTEGGNLGSASGYGVRMLYNGADNKFYIKTGVAETITDRITILRDNGYVGIGTTTPGYLLDVYGTLRVAGALTGGSTASFSSTVSVATPTAASHATTKSYVDTAVTNAIAGLTVTLYDVASGTTGTAVCDAQNAICLDVVATDTNPSLSYSCLWTTTSSTLKARCLK